MMAAPPVVVNQSNMADNDDDEAFLFYFFGRLNVLKRTARYRELKLTYVSINQSINFLMMLIVITIHSGIFNCSSLGFKGLYHQEENKSLKLHLGRKEKLVVGS